MKSMILTMALAFGTAATLSAQAPAAEGAARQETRGASTCAIPNMGAVQELKLEQAQLVRIREIQAETMRECAAAKEADAQAEIMAKHQARVQEVLSPEQYARYQALPTERRPEKKEVKMKEQTN